MNYTSLLGPELAELPEMKFSIGVVSYIANQNFPGILLPYPPEFNEILTFDVCARIHDACIDFREDYPNAYEDLFYGYDKTQNNFCILCILLADAFLNVGYSHTKFIKFCCEISEYATSMYKEGCSDAFKIAIFTLYCILWKMKDYWDSTDEIPTLMNHWKYLDWFCKSTGDENKENKPLNVNN